MNERYPQLQAALTTRDGFERAVRIHNGWDTMIVIGILGFGGCWLFNLTATIRGMVKERVPIRYFFDVFFNTDGIWGGIMLASAALLALTVLAAIAKVATNKSSFDKLFQKYQTSGFLGTAYPLATPIRFGKEQQVLVAYAHPSVPLESVTNLATFLSAQALNAPDTPEFKDWKKRLVKVAADLRATPASTVDPMFPAGIWFARVLPDNEALGIVAGAPGESGTRPVVLLPDDPKDATVFTLKTDVPIS
ncbi:MAG: hypothetical protein LBC29_03765 [Propionibacteriaceae bacterium]|jgi:hypothetical protein|nr:hypothetical protein [Propionibacteriaceae bacterium]